MRLHLVSLPQRGLRVLKAFLPVLVQANDAFARSLLDPTEYRLYLRMDPRDREHACLIAKRLIQEYPHASSALKRAALLHDVGKSVTPYNPLYRVLAHLYIPTLPAEPRLTGLRAALQVGQHHSRYGAEMILAAGGDPRVADIVARHHHPAGDDEARALEEIDARY